MKDITYEKIIQVWGGSYKRIDYKDRWISITARKRAKDNRVVYLGEFCSKDYKRSKSIESIHYDKVISKFEKYVDEYCTDWQPKKQFQYKGYLIEINKEKGKEYYLGTVTLHKNSVFKHIADDIEEVERCCKNRIGRVVYEKEKTIMTKTREEKIKYIEDQIASLSAELEKVKNEKQTLTYKGVTLELIPEKDNYFSGIIKNAPKNTCSFYNDEVSEMRQDFQRYINELEESAYIYLKLTGQEIAKVK